MPPAKRNPGEWGTAEFPLLMSQTGWDHLHPFLQSRMRHVHIFQTGECITDGFVRCLAQPVGACVECGNDDPCEGFELCSDCLEEVSA